MQLRVHAFVEDADDQQFRFGEAVEDEVALDGKDAQAGGDVVAGRAHLWRLSQGGELALDFVQVFGFLTGSPLTAGVLGDPDEIGFGGGREAERPRARQRRRPGLRQFSGRYHHRGRGRRRLP